MATEQCSFPVAPQGWGAAGFVLAWAIDGPKPSTCAWFRSIDGPAPQTCTWFRDIEGQIKKSSCDVFVPGLID